MMPSCMPMKGLIILSFYQKERITEQVHNDAAMNYFRWYQNKKQFLQQSTLK
jgi:hypothetical protein